MRRPSIKFGSSLASEPLWARYAFALAASGLGCACELWLNHMFDLPVTPFLPGFAVVIFSAAWAGFGPGLFAMATVVCWAAWFFQNEHRLTPGAQIARLAVFVAEGLLLSIGIARLNRAMREFAASDEWHRRLVDSSAEGIWVCDVDGAITYANPRIAEILGVAADAIAGRKMEEFFFPADLSIERIRFLNRRAGLKEQFDRRLRHDGGGEVWVLACSDPLFDGKHQFRGALSMMTDITERKRAEQALRRSEARFRGLFENVLEGVYQSTPDGRIAAANPMLLRMLGLANEAELNDVNIAKDLYVDPGVRQRLIERLETDGSFQNVEYELRRRDGQIITVQENARVVRDDDGQVLYYEGTLSDISDRSRMESQLREAQKIEAIGRLAGGIAHDFSNILTIISGFARLTLSDLDPFHPARVNAQQVVNAAESATALTQQLLSFSRRQMAAVAADLNLVVRRSEEAIVRVIGGKGRLSVSVSAEPLIVYIDRAHLDQIVVNLTINARNAMPEGGTLEIRTEPVNVDAASARRLSGARPGDYAAFSMRSSASRSGIPSGNIGLSTTQAIVSQYGGFLVVDSHPDRGSAFTVYLPRAEADGYTDSIAEETSSGPGSTRVLLVDDEPMVRELSREMLERQGYQVFVATDAAEAERISLQDGRFDLLITDIVMPRISGPELARRLRTSRPDLKVLFISGYADEFPESGDPELKGASNGEDFLHKPFSADSLGRKIRQMLERP